MENAQKQEMTAIGISQGIRCASCHNFADKHKIQHIMTIKIDSLADWSAVEMKAQEHEMSTIETPKVPLPTMAQSLSFATIRCAELQASVHRKNGAITEAIMYLSIGATQRAQEVLNRGLLDP